MTDPCENLVCRAVAHHLGIDPASVRLYDPLAALPLQPLDIVMIALRIEDTQNVVLPIDSLEVVHTVAQFAALVRRVHLAKHHGEAAVLVPFGQPGRGAKRRVWLRRMVA